MTNKQNILPWLDVIALLAWGIILVKYFFSGQLKLLIHPNYFWLVLITGMILLVVTAYKAWQLWQQKQKPNLEAVGETSLQHINLFPPGWASSMLLVTAILAISIGPAVLASQTAIQRGLSASLPLTRNQPESFRTSTLPEDRSIIDWVRTLNAYPEPDAYTGQKAKVSGFVVRLSDLPDNYFLICRFIITCCAVDAYPVGIPVKFEGSPDLYPPDTWLEVEGKMITETLSIDETQTGATTANKRQLVLAANSLKQIPTPADPYGY